MRAVISIATLVALAFGPMATPQKENNPVKPETDREQILQHIHSIFQAYIRQDRDTIRRTHTADWVGFQGPSTQIERGIDAYMVNAEKSLQSYKGTGYELLDTEIQIYGDLALVYYVAHYDFLDQMGYAGSLRLKSIDVYRREGTEWNQCGSHITSIPQPGSAKRRILTRSESDALLKAREDVWRAWFAGDKETLLAAVPEEAIAMDPDLDEWATRAEIVRRSAEFAADGKLIRLDFPETQVQVYDNVAVLYTRFELETSQNGKTVKMAGRGTEVFAFHDGKWVNTGWHLERR